MRGALAFLVLALVVPRAALATTAADLCPPSADPCVLDSTVLAGPDSLLDFGTRDFVIAGTGRLEIANDAVLEIRAGSVVLEAGPGARIRNTPGSVIGAIVVIEAAIGDISLRTAARPLGIDVSGQQAGGQVELLAAGDIVLEAELHAKGTTAESDGGFVILEAAGDLHIAADVLLAGGADGLGGELEGAAGEEIHVTARNVDVSGGFGGGSILLESGGDVVTTARMNLSGQGLCADGGFLIVESGGDVFARGPIMADATGSPEEGGCLGGDVGLAAAGHLFIEDRIDMSGGSPDGEGGIGDLVAGQDVYVTAPVVAIGRGLDGFGGSVDVVAGRLAQIDAQLDVHGGGDGGGGSVSVNADQQVLVDAEINADGGRGVVLLTTSSLALTTVPGRVTITDRVHAQGGTQGGIITVETCDVSLPRRAEAAVDGDGALNDLVASGAIVIGGRLTAGKAGRNLLRYRATEPVILRGSTVTPKAQALADGSLRPCGSVCGNGVVESGERCDAGDGNVTAGGECNILCEPPVICSERSGPICEPCATDLECDALGRCRGTACVEGVCTAVAPLVCDDGNPCTDDSCDGSAGCRTVALDAAGIPGCDNANVCDGTETCVTGACEPGTPPPADDGDPCTDDGPCDPARGYLRTPKIGFPAATCRLEAILGTLDRATPAEVVKRARRKLAKLAGKAARKLVAAEGRSGKGRAKQLKKAAKLLVKLQRLLERSLARGRIEQTFAARLLPQALGAVEAVGTLQAAAS